MKANETFHVLTSCYVTFYKNIKTSNHFKA